MKTFKKAADNVLPKLGTVPISKIFNAFTMVSVGYITWEMCEK